MSSLRIGPFRLAAFDGDLADLVAGHRRPDALKDLDERLPQPNSLRRACEDAKAAVLAAADLLRLEGIAVSERLGVYIGQQQIALDNCAQFIGSSYREGPRMASPMLFSESVANNAATHLSLTLGIRGIAQTFIGTRVAGLQALLAAAEDMEAGVVDMGLVVVIGASTPVTLDAYHAVQRPFRRKGAAEIESLRGAMAVLVRREAAGQPGLSFVGVRCLGRRPQAQLEAVGGLWKECTARVPAGTRFLESTLRLARDRSLGILRQVGPTTLVGEGLGESFALDPFVRLLIDSAERPGRGGRAVVCLGEEGTVGILALDGPARPAPA